VDRLIDLTVAQARQQSRFYSERFSDLSSTRPVGYEQLADLPVLHREDVERAGATIRSRYASYGLTSYTSGTTRARPLSIDRSRQEERYLAELVTRLQGGSTDHRQVVLLLATWHHGMQIRLPGSAVSLPVYLSNEIGFVQARALLERTFQIAGEDVSVTAIAGSINRLQQLTAYLQRKGVDLPASVDLLQTTGRYVTRHAARELADAWDARLVDRFSLTELFLGATRCDGCGWFHFDCFGVPEVVDQATQARLSTGRGSLLLTGLYPFTQMTPLIRYATGDLAEVAGVDCAWDDVGYRLLGRDTSAVLLDGVIGPGQFLSGGEVYEVLDPLADVNRLRDPPTPTESRTSLDPRVVEAGGLPVFQPQVESDRAVVEVELRYAPAAFPLRAAAVAHEIEHALKERHPWLASAISRGAFAVRVDPPDSLPRRGVTRP